jgi:hypothetical protein
MIAGAVGHEEAPSFISGGGGKYQDRIAVRELELDVAALCLIRAGPDKSITCFYSRARAFVAVEQGLDAGRLDGTFCSGQNINS